MLELSCRTIGGVELEVWEAGEGRPILFLHPWSGPDHASPILSRLASYGRVVAPSHPGFGGSPLPADFSTVDDIAYLYLDLLEASGLRDWLVIGVSFGAWVAAEIAVKSVERIGALVLAAPIGIKLGDRERPAIVDHFSLDQASFAALAYADPQRHASDFSAMADDEMLVAARNRDAAALYGWNPYMYDPKLAQRLHRVRRPALVIRGAQDRVTAADYADRFAALLPQATVRTIEQAGHFPHVEQPETFARLAAEWR